MKTKNVLGQFTYYRAGLVWLETAALASTFSPSGHERSAKSATQQLPTVNI